MTISLQEWQNANRKELQPPQTAWPTIGLFFLALFMFIGTIALVLGNMMPLWLGFIINSVAQFMMFTVAHDASHRSLSQNERVNEYFGQMAAFVLSPFAGLKVFRFIHMQHHRFTNEGTDVDPDEWAGKGTGIFRVFFWSTVDFYYVYWYLKRWHQRPVKERRELITTVISRFALMGFLVWMGYGLEVLVLYLLSGRVAATWLALAFDYLPHYPHDTKASDNELRATNLKPELSAIMTPLLLAQNYHLIHHLYPRVPFYRYKRVWMLAKEPLIAAGARIMHWNGKDFV